ncbi:unnamed protein product, partial [Hapterophycus canaliculatus]
MVLYFLSTGGTPYFPPPEDRTEVTIAKFRQQTRLVLSEDNFSVDLKRVRAPTWRRSLRRALITKDDQRGTASEVL